MRAATRRPGPRRRALAGAGVAVLGLALAACGDGAERADDATATPAAPAAAGAGGTGQAEGTVSVLAAASLTDAFGEIEAAFEAANPDADLDISYGGSSALRDQVLSGQPVDVVASASGTVMDDLVEAGAVDGEPQDFATNKLEIVVPAGNPAGIEGLADLADEDALVGLCAEEVPCGAFGRRALEEAGVEAAPDTNEPDVRSLLDKVASGELDVGLVYATDVAAAGDAVEGIEVPDDENVVATYPIAGLTDAPNADGAAAFVAFVTGDGGQAVLADFEFGPVGA
jgi:molybdate transport system substrate-binding protein